MNGIRHVIFLSGDYHLSAVAELEIRAVGAAAPVRAVSVVSSGWNATLPFANAQRRDYVEDQPVACPLGHPDVEVWSRTGVMSTEPRQFSKLTLEKAGSGWALGVSVFGPGGDGPEQLLSAKTLQL
jgi:cholesterol oxidase